MFQRPSPNIALPTDASESHKDEVETVVGPSVNVEGDFASEGNIIVKGTVSGSVKTSKILTVEEGAKIFANVRAGSAIVSGSIKGNIRVDERLELRSSAQIAGDVACKILSVEAGALISGKISMEGISLEDGRERRGGLIRSRIRPQIKEEDAEETA